MFINLLLKLGTGIVALLIIVKCSQYVMMRYLTWNFDLMETVLMPVTVLGSFVVGYFIANRAEKSEAKAKDQEQEQEPS